MSSNVSSAFVPPSSVLGNHVVRCRHALAGNQLRNIAMLPVHLAEDGEFLWIRYRVEDAASKAAADCLPGEHFQVIDDDLLVRPGKEIATFRLPSLHWNAAEDFIACVLPKVMSAGRLKIDAKTRWQLVRGGSETRSDAALIDWELLADWVENAPQERLERLHFCVRRGRRSAVQELDTPDKPQALVIGSPLPPIPCRYLCSYRSLLIPAGFTWEPGLPVDIVLRSFQIEDNQRLLWLPESIECVPDEMLRPLRRSNVRAMRSDLGSEL